MTDIDFEVADSFERIFPVPTASANWDDVLQRAGWKRAARLRHGSHRRRVVLVMAALLLVIVASTSAFGTVRNLFFGERRIAAAWLGAPRWSPEGRHIAFGTVACNHGCSGPFELNVMNADGSGQRNLTREWRLEVAPIGGLPIWSPDSRKIAFVQGRGVYRAHPVHGRYSDIHVIDADGSGRRRLTRSPQNDGDPVWSPNGRRLAFVRVRGGRADIYLVNGDGSGLRRLAHAIAFAPMPGGPSAGWNANPAWSPDGRRVAFVSNRDGNDDIFVVNADGSGLRNLTRSERNDRDPMWSPDGRAIVFQGRRDAPSELERVTCRSRCWPEEIYVIGADGTALRRLTHNWRVDRTPVWSPDGRKVLFVSRHDVYVMNADGSGQRNLTRSTTQPLATDEAPTWSPDGRKILFVSNRGDGNWFDVYVMNADGSGKRKLTQLKGRG